jgi:hypothetical protein
MPRQQRNPGHLYLNRSSDQLSRRTPPAIVNRERRKKPDSPPSSPATTPSSVPIGRAVPIPALVQSASVSSVPQWQTLVRSSRVTSHESPVTPIHALARSFSLLRLFFQSRSFIFNRLRTLLRKHRGGIPLPDFHESQVASDQSRPSCAKSAKTPPSKSFACHSYKLPVA